MTNEKPLPQLRFYLLACACISALLLTAVYTLLLDRYLLLGIDLRTESLLEQTAQRYEQILAESSDRALPSETNIKSYLAFNQIPSEFRDLFSIESPNHGELHTLLNIDLDGDTPDEMIDTLDLCEARRCELVFLYTYQLQSGEWLYILHGLVGSEEIYAEIEFLESTGFLLGAGFIAAFMILALLGSRSINSPLQRLEAWSLSLSSDDPTPDLDNLRFRELKTLADQLSYAFEKMRLSTENEKLFLRHASHELRTPLAILSTNIELIEKVTERPGRTELEQNAFTRQYHALNDINLLIETLLWINRQSDKMPPLERISVDAELRTIIEQFSYLLAQKSVTVGIRGNTEINLDAPGAALRIVLSNLVRNAFQYTPDGEISIHVHHNAVTIENPHTGQNLEAQKEYGFGFGLELVQRICEHLDWRLETTIETSVGSHSETGTRKTAVYFGEPEPSLAPGTQPKSELIYSAESIDQEPT